MAYSLLPSSFDDIKSYLVRQINTKYPTLGSFLQASFLIIFVDVVAWAIALFMDFADNTFNENHLETAVQYENARLIAQFYGYTAHRRISAEGEIEVGMTSAFNTLPTENITFNKWDAISIAGIKFLIYESVTFSSNPLDNSYVGLPTGTYYVTLPVIQGQLIKINNVAQGIQGENYTVSDASVENANVYVYVNTVLYTQVSSFFASSTTDAHCTVENISEMAGIKVTFGDGYRGKRLSAGDAVAIWYVKTDGLNGQIKSSGFPVTFLSSYHYLDTTPVTFYGTSISQMIGADEKETLDSVKYWGRKAASSLSDKAFNDDEVQLELQQFGGILKSKAISEYDVNPLNPDPQYMNAVKLLIVPTAGGNPDTITQQRIREYLRPKMDFTDFIYFIDVEYIDILFSIAAEVFNNAPQDLATQIDTYLQTSYTLGTLDFGKSIDHSHVSYQVTNQFVSYIKRFLLTLWVTETSLTPVIGSGSTITKTLKMGGFRTPSPSIHSCSIVANFNIGATSYTEVLMDNGSGLFIPTVTGSSIFITSGYIDYITGVINLTLHGSVTSVASIEYRYDTYDVDGNTENIDIKYFQIIRYGKSIISTEVVSG
jgi:hypothetical protein